MKKGTIYPAWRYHRELPAKIIQDEAEDKALGPDWAKTPAAFDKLDPPPVEAHAAHPADPPSQHDAHAPEVGPSEDLASLPIEDLRRIAKERGIAVHHKAGRDKILAALKEESSQ